MPVLAGPLAGLAAVLPTAKNLYDSNNKGSLRNDLAVIDHALANLSVSDATYTYLKDILEMAAAKQIRDSAGKAISDDGRPKNTGEIETKLSGSLGDFYAWFKTAASMGTNKLAEWSPSTAKVGGWVALAGYVGLSVGLQYITNADATTVLSVVTPAMAYLGSLSLSAGSSVEYDIEKGKLDAALVKWKLLCAARYLERRMKQEGAAQHAIILDGHPLPLTKDNFERVMLAINLGLDTPIAADGDLANAVVGSIAGAAAGAAVTSTSLVDIRYPTGVTLGSRVIPPPLTADPSLKAQIDRVLRQVFAWDETKKQFNHSIPSPTADVNPNDFATKVEAARIDLEQHRRKQIHEQPQLAVNLLDERLKRVETRFNQPAAGAAGALDTITLAVQADVAGLKARIDRPVAGGAAGAVDTVVVDMVDRLARVEARLNTPIAEREGVSPNAVEPKLLVLERKLAELEHNAATAAAKAGLFGGGMARRHSGVALKDHQHGEARKPGPGFH